MNKLLFLIKRPSIFLVAGQGYLTAEKAVFQVLDKRALVFGSSLDKVKDIKKYKFLLNKSKLPVLVGTHVGEIPDNKGFFEGEKKKALAMIGLAKTMPGHGYLILNFDDETVREIKDKIQMRSLTFGFQKGADLRAIDINVNPEGTNFKIEYMGKIVPFWLNGIFGKEQIYSALAAAGAGIVGGMNLVEISQAIKLYN